SGRSSANCGICEIRFCCFECASSSFDLTSCGGNNGFLTSCRGNRLHALAFGYNPVASKMSESLLVVFSLIEICAGLRMRGFGSGYLRFGLTDSAEGISLSLPDRQAAFAKLGFQHADFLLGFDHLRFSLFDRRSLLLLTCLYLVIIENRDNL